MGDSVDFFDAVYCICMDDRPQKQKRLFSQIYSHVPEWSPTLFQAISTRHLKNHHIGCALSHRSVIQEAQDKKYKNILVFEEDALLHKDFRKHLVNNIVELNTSAWDILYLGACVWNPKPPQKPRTFSPAPHCHYLKTLTGSTCTQALAYNHSSYDYILNALPDNIEDMAHWCKKHAAIDQWLMYKMQGSGSVKDGFREFNCYITDPRICSQPFLIGRTKQDKPFDFHDKP